MTGRFRGGRNIAMKVPAHRFDTTVAFYERTLDLPVRRRQAASVAFEFGSCTLWIDRVDHLSQAEVWLELVTDDVPGAAEHLVRREVSRCDAIETLPEGFDGFWVVNPADVVHLVARDDD